ncbi:Putative SOS response-associated peptidase YedK [Rhodospirillales bacterium URHD0017]|nr:Putative SOS response-associated peptidase YedK [Rhodospirillales bacterium URHD0017]
MCNLYRVRQSVAEIAAHFGVHPPAFDIPQTKRGERGVIVRGAANRRVMLEVNWGFPRPQKDRGGKLLHHEPVNLIADLTNPMWDKMVPDPRYRCLIPVTAFAQPDGKRGTMTRTWFSVTDWPLFAWAGFCRHSEEWGPVYGAMTTDSNAAVAPLNPRMPVILAPDEYERWLEGTVNDVIDFQFRPPLPPERMTIERTKELWVPRRPPHASHRALI